MSGETGTWNPSAEPWEALREADARAGTTYSDAPSPLWERQAEALSEMGWHLSPYPPSELSRCVEELEAENERLRGALEVPEAKSHEFSIPGVTEEWRRFWVRMDNGQLLFAESAPGDEQPSQAEYVEAFERARRRVEQDAPSSRTEIRARVSASAEVEALREIRDRADAALVGGPYERSASVGDDTGPEVQAWTIEAPGCDVERVDAATATEAAEKWLAGLGADAEELELGVGDEVLVTPVGETVRCSLYRMVSEGRFRQVEEAK